jgi:hypothetical protein
MERSDLSDWDDHLYKEIFDSMLHYLEKRRQKDPYFSREVLRKLIETEYVKQDNAWAGKSPVEEIKDAATIAAFEHFLEEWKD